MSPFVLHLNLPFKGYVELGLHLVLEPDDDEYKPLLYSPIFFWLYTPWGNISNLPLDKEKKNT